MADVSEPQSPNSTPKPSYRDVEYGSIIDAETPDRADSGVQVSPVEPQSGHVRGHQYRILPPRISGHGRLIAAHRTVPYWLGVVFVVGSFAWAVFCAIYIYRLGAG
ncbi:hypothetical protein J1614_007235 [Plenodomus biglobosus]|nr:hypothetical protein J1614_007235 [Plenodomus biglobosus]